MKQKTYQNKILIIYIVIFTIILEIAFSIYLNTNKIYTYKKLSCITTGKKTCLLVVNTKEKNLLYKNTILYIKNKPIPFNIEQDSGVVITKEHEKYYEVLIKLNKNFNSKETITCLLKDKKVKLTKLFTIIWEGDEN